MRSYVWVDPINIFCRPCEGDDIFFEKRDQFALDRVLQIDPESDMFLGSESSRLTCTVSSLKGLHIDGSSFCFKC